MENLIQFKSNWTSLSYKSFSKSYSRTPPCNKVPEPQKIIWNPSHLLTHFQISELILIFVRQRIRRGLWPPRRVEGSTNHPIPNPGEGLPLPLPHDWKLPPKSYDQQNCHPQLHFSLT